MPQPPRRLRPSLLLLVPTALAAGVLMCCVRHSPPADAPRETSQSLPSIRDGPWMNASLPAEERTTLLLREMTQEEKLVLIFGYFGTPQGWNGYTPPAEARRGSAGYVPGVPRLGIPAQWQTDAGVGVATQGSEPLKRERTALPSGLLIASSWNPDVARRGGAMIGSEARADGFNVMLAGGVNLLRDAYNGRNFEYGGEDPWLAGTMVGAQVQGIQSNHIISTVKHFAINDQETDRKGGSSQLDRAAAHESDLLAFEIAIELGQPGAIMCAYNKVDGIFACESPYLLTEVLREDWGYRGFVMSDWGATHSAAAAANAGLEQETGWPFDDEAYFQEPLKRALSSGKVTGARLDEMATRILRQMFTHGLFDHPAEEGGAIDAQANVAVSQAAAEEGIVLLQNTGGILPLSKRLKRIALIGGHADRGVLSGGGSSQVYPAGGNAVPGIAPQTWPGPVVYYPSSPLGEIQQLVPEADVRFADGHSPEEAAELARNCEVAIVFATQWATESVDTAVALPDAQDALIAAVARANPKTIVVLETGGPVLTPWAPEVAGVVEAWYPGIAGGKAIARVLFGDVNPSGHLATTFPADVHQLAHPAAPQAGEVRYTEGAAVGYKWFDKKSLQPRFAFGHGLSYTSFRQEVLGAEDVKGEVNVRARIENTGSERGRDVVQVYASGPQFEAPRRLVGYSKVELEPGAAQELSLKVDSRLLGRWDRQKRRFVIAAGTYEFFVGESSRQLSAPVALELPERSLGSSKQAPEASAGTAPRAAPGPTP